MRAFIASTVGAACMAALAAATVLPHSAVFSHNTVFPHKNVAHAAQSSPFAPEVSPFSPAAAAAPGVQSLPLQPLEPPRGRTRSAAPPSGATAGLGLPATETEPFSLLGIIWTDPAAGLQGRVEVRTRASDTGEWSPWRALATHPEHAPEPDSVESTAGGVRGGTAPLWVGASDAVQVRVEPEATERAAVPAAALPEGLRLELIDPGPAATGSQTGPEPGTGTSTGPETGTERPKVLPELTVAETLAAAGMPAGMSARMSARMTAGTGTGDNSTSTVTRSRTVGTTAGTPRAATRRPFVGPRPAIVTRAGWGADERLRESGFVYTGSVKTAFVHHTAMTNNYTCRNADAVIRSIYRYHVKSQGWRDIGYNFLVDRCGNVYEGRAGGADRAVQGAHTLGHNRNSMGVAVLGTYSSARPSKRALNAVAQLTSWKLGLYGVNPLGSSKRVSAGGTHPTGTRVEMDNIAGHRDGSKTDCPGTRLYKRLPVTRQESARFQGR